MNFELTKEEYQKYTKWADAHTCKYRIKEKWMSRPTRYVGAIGGEDTFCFTPTGLGTIIKVKCRCGAELDLTNYEEW